LTTLQALASRCLVASATLSLMISRYAEKGLSKKGWNRFVLEKPFGRDAESSAELSRKLSKVRVTTMSHHVLHSQL